MQARLENGGQRLVYAAAACQRNPPRQDVLLANGTLTARPDYTLADKAPARLRSQCWMASAAGTAEPEGRYAAAEALDPRLPPTCTWN